MIDRITIPRKQTIAQAREIVIMGTVLALRSASSFFIALANLKKPKQTTSKLNTRPIIIILNICIVLSDSFDTNIMLEIKNGKKKMRITDRNLGYEAEYKNGNYIIKRNTIIEKFTDIEPIPKTAKVYKKGRRKAQKRILGF